MHWLKGTTFILVQFRSIFSPVNVIQTQKVVNYKPAFFLGLFAFLTVSCTEENFTALKYPGFAGFDTDSEGWHVSEGAIGSYSVTGGNPGGYTVGTDNENGFWYFIASRGFVSETQRSYGRTLSFDLEQSAIDSQANADDIILTDGTSTLTYNTAYNPKTTWTHYSVKLDDVSGWKKGSSNATKEDVLHVLQNLTDLRIRGEFRAGPDRGGLDNVMIY